MRGQREPHTVDSDPEYWIVHPELRHVIPAYPTQIACTLYKLRTRPGRALEDWNLSGNDYLFMYLLICLYKFVYRII